MKTVKEQKGNLFTNELIEVKPLSQPSGTPYYMDFIYNPKPKFYIHSDGTIVIKKRNYKQKRIIL